MYFGHRTTNTVTNRVQIDFVFEICFKGLNAVCILNTFK